MRSSIRVSRPRFAGTVAALALVVASVQFAAAPASAGPSRPAAPSVSLLKLSPTTVGRSGGSVHLHATVAHAATCTVSSSPHLSGLPATHNCASGHLAETLHVGSNPSTSLRQFTIKLRVTKAGHHVTKSVHLTQDGVLPTVHALAASPTTVPAAGGSTHVTATVAHATKCRLSATPAVAGLPVTTSCSATYSRHVTLPANTSATARQYAFTLVVRGAGGSVTDSTHPHVTVKGAIHPITTTTAKAAPLPSNANTGTSEDATLVAVSCPAAAHCVAVGYYYGTAGSDSSAQLGLIDTFNGTSWTAREAPTPSDISTTEPAVIISSVSCSSATSCVAVGDYLDSVPGLEPYVAVLSGTTWTAESASVPTNASYPTLRLGGNLRDVSCASNGCVAVGIYNDPTAGQEALIESPDGSSWVGAAAPLPGGADSTNQNNYLNAISCMSATACSAVGGYVSGGDEAGLGEVLAQGSWSAAQLAPTADLGEDNVVSCAGTSCTGSGDYNTNVAVIQSQVAGAWTPAGEIPAPLPAVNTGSAKLNGVDCASASSCVLAGSYYTSGSDSAGLIDIGSGTSFAATEAPLPSNATTNNFVTTLSAVSCGSANACVAAGAYEDTNSHIQALIDTESDGGGTPSWTSTEAPLPSGGTSPTLKAISCANSYGCVAVGTYLPSTDTAGGVIVMTAP